MSRTNTETISRPSISSQEDEQTPTSEDQIRGYRLRQRLQFEVQRRMLRGRRYQRSLKSQLNPDAELNMTQYRRAQQIPAETLYQAGWSETNHRVYQHYSDQRIRVTDGSQIELPFITRRSYERLVNERLQHLHIGIIMIRLYTLHQRNAGVTVLVLLRDTRWLDDRAIISSMEMDLTSGTQLVYTAPDMTVSIHDFNNHIQLVVQTHGYEGWQGGESNLLLSRSLIGRLSNTSHTNFRYNVNHVPKHLANRGIRAIPGQRHSTEELRGRQWIIRPAEAPAIQNPQSLRMRTRTDGSLSIKFGDYSSTQAQEESTVGEADEEEFALMANIFNETSESDSDDELETLQLLAGLPREGSRTIEPIWDAYPDSEEEWINPFSQEGGGDESAYSAMEYPMLRELNSKIESTFSAISTAESSRRPTEP